MLGISQERRKDFSIVFWSIITLTISTIANYANTVMIATDFIASVAMLVGIIMSIIGDLKNSNIISKIGTRLFYLGVTVRLANAAVGLVR